MVLVGVVLSTLAVITLVWASGTIAESHQFTFWGDGFYLLSHPLYSDVSTAMALETALKNQNGDEPDLELDVAIRSEEAGQPPTFTCYPVGSTIIDDAFPDDPSTTCTTTTNSLSFGSREPILIRIRNVSCTAPGAFPVCFPPQTGCAAGGCVDLTWNGSDIPFAVYDIVANVKQWISIPFNQAPTTADDVLDALAPDGGTVTRVLATTPPVYQFWTGSVGNGVPQNFTTEIGEGLQVTANTTGTRVLAVTAGATVSGTVFQDLEPNGVFDGADFGIPFRQVRLIHDATGVTMATKWTDSSGQYSFVDMLVPPDTYQISVVPQGVEAWSPAGGTIAVSPVDASDVFPGSDFGREPIHDLAMDLYRIVPAPLRVPCSTATTPGNQIDYCIRFRNVGAFDEDEAQVVLDLPPASQATFLSTFVAECSNTPPPAPPSVVGTQVTWSVTSPFEPGDACTVCASLQVEPPLGDTLTAMGSIFLDAASTLDTVPATQNSDSQMDQDRCAVDPNDKLVTPAGCGDSGFVGRGETFTYLVRFQNNGNAAATRVQIADILDGALDMSTLHIVDTSHQLTGAEVLQDRRLVLTFDNINLPPASSDPEGSQGFVLFEIAPLAGLPSGTKILNSAGIVFDLNAPLFTNTVVNTVTDHAIPASGIPTPEVCNDVDDDCDGTVDQFMTSCGVGGCASTGTCTGGLDNCVPGSPETESCDGLDNDCDGLPDNLPPPSGTLNIAAVSTTRFEWAGLGGADGYDVARGSGGALHATQGDFSTAVDSCLVDGSSALFFEDPTVPSVSGEFLMYLGRGTNCGVPGSYGSPDRDEGLSTAPSGCD